MIRKLQLFLSRVTKKIQIFVLPRQGRLFFLTLILIFLMTFANLPYFNIFLLSSNIVWIMIVMIFFLFRISEKYLLITAIYLTGIAFISFLFSNKNFTEILGNTIFVVIVIGFFYDFRLFARDLKNDKYK